MPEMTEEEKGEFIFTVIVLLGIFHCYADALKRALKMNSGTLGALAGKFRLTLKQLQFFLDGGSIDGAFGELGSIVLGIETFLYVPKCCRPQNAVRKMLLFSVRLTCLAERGCCIAGKSCGQRRRVERAGSLATTPGATSGAKAATLGSSWSRWWRCSSTSKTSETPCVMGT